MIEDVENESEETNFLYEILKLTAGQTFGELALTDLKFQRRKANVKCITPCAFAVLRKEDYDELLAKHVIKRTLATYSFLSGNPLFQAAPVSYLRTRGWNADSYGRNKVMLRERSEAKLFFVVRRGHLELTRKISKLINPQGDLEFIKNKKERGKIKDTVH